MKKILLFASALAGLFLAGSCQRENLEPQQTEQQVTFTIEAPAALQTKAIADGLNVDELIYEVWITEAQNAETLDGATRLYQAKTDMTYDETNKRMKANITLDLVNDQNFTILFWAQKKNIGVYDTDWLNAVTYTNLEENAYAANDARLDAFYAKAYVVDCQTSTPTVVLRRPFAQVNLCTLNSKDAAQVDGNYNMTLVSSEMRLDAVPTVFNVATSEASDLVAMDFLVNAVPSGVDQKITVNGKEYYYAGMNYVFAGTTFELTYDIQAQLNGTVDVNINNTIQNVPLKENHRTNIVGNLLTSQTDFEIIVDAAFNEPDEMVEVVSVSTAAELVEALTPAAGSTPVEGESTNIKLEGDINLSDLFPGLTKSTAEEPKNITIPAGLTTTIDLNGYSLTGVDEGTASFGLIYNCGNLTITNSSSTQSRIALFAQNDRGWNAYSSVLSNNPGGNLLVKGNVLIEHIGGTAMAYGIDNLTNGKGTSAITTVEGATVKSPYRAIRQFLNGVEATNELYVKAGSKIYGPDNKSIWMQDPSANANTGKLVVEAGAELYGDVYLTVTAGSTEWPVEVSIADAALFNGAKVLSNNVPAHLEVANVNGYWTVVESWIENGNEVLIKSAHALEVFAAKVNAGDTFEGKTVKLAADIDLQNENWTPIGYWQTFNGTFDGQNHTISNLKHHGTEEDCYVGLFGYTENATIKNLTINNVDLKLVANADWAGGHMGALVGNADGATVIENITVTGDVKIDGDLTKAGAGRIGGVIGGNLFTGTIKNVVVNANEGSFVKGNSSVGGIAGQLQPGAIAGTLTFENCSSNIDVTAQQFGAGGIIGTGSYLMSFTNCSTSGNIRVLAGRSGNDNDLYRVGAIVGSWDENDHGTDTIMLEGCSYTGTVAGASADGRTAVAFDCDGYVGRGYSAKEGAKVSVNGTEYEYAGGGIYKVGDSYIVHTADALVAALEKKYDVILGCDIKINPANMSNAYGKTGINVKYGQTIDGNGHTLNIQGAGGTWDSGINTTGGIIKNLTVTGSFRGIFINHTSDYSEKVVLENVTITGTVYTISCDQGLYQGIEATGCTFNGWTSFAKTAGEAKFVECTFGEGSGYKYCRPYSNTEFVNCTFCPGYAVDTTCATVTFTDCTWEE